MGNNKNDLLSRLKQMPTDQLDEILRAEIEKEVPDDDLVLRILRILEEREKGKPVVLNEKEQAVWRKYQKKARRRGRGLTVHWGRIMTVAASLVVFLCMLFGAMTQEAKAGSIYDFWAWCADNVLAFFSSGEEDILLEYEYKTENPGLQQFRDAVVEYGGTERALMMWIPDESKLISIEIDEMPDVTSVTAEFSEENGLLVIRADIYNIAKPFELYKNLPDPHEWEMHGTTHYVVQNRDQWMATWGNGNVECFITLECQEDILKNILRSIYVMEEK